MNKIPARTHKFCRGEAPRDRKCLFWSFLDVMKPFLIAVLGNVLFERDLMEALNEDLRVRVADYIRSHTEMHYMVLASAFGYKTVEQYCSDIMQVKLLAGEPELHALSSLYNILICKIDLINIRGDKCLSPSYYGENNPLATQCVYIYYNGRDHFDPLFIKNRTNPNEKETMFDPNDETVNDLLRKFIKEELKFEGRVELGVKTAIRTSEVSKPTDGSNEIEIVSNSILPNISTKHKEPGVGYEIVVDNIRISSNNDMSLPISISNKYSDSNKRFKATKDATDGMSKFYENNSETMTTKHLIQDDDDLSESDPPVTQQQIEDVLMALNDEYQEEKVESEKEPDKKIS